MYHHRSLGLLEQNCMVPRSPSKVGPVTWTEVGLRIHSRFSYGLVEAAVNRLAYFKFASCCLRRTPYNSSYLCNL